MWEYKTETFISIVDNERKIKEKSNLILEKYGKDNWELVNFQCVGALGSMMIFVFKRLKAENRK